MLLVLAETMAIVDLRMEDNILLCKCYTLCFVFCLFLLKGYDAPAVKRNGAVGFFWAMVGWMNDRTEPDFFACVCKAGAIIPLQLSTMQVQQKNAIPPIYTISIWGGG
jgi:hypothetical protein